MQVFCQIKMSGYAPNTIHEIEDKEAEYLLSKYPEHFSIPGQSNNYRAVVAARAKFNEVKNELDEAEKNYAAEIAEIARIKAQVAATTTENKTWASKEYESKEISESKNRGKKKRKK